ncbi:MAG: hypothetical protein QXS41_00590 [Candidatus Woesearchaeota archaeon]
MYFKIKKNSKSRIRKQNLEKVINELYSFAINYRGKNRDYVLKQIGKRIWKIKLSYRINLKKEVKRFLCRKCNTILIPSINLRVRNYKGFMEYKCIICDNVRRYRIKG